MGADCLGSQYAITKSKSAIAENTEFDGSAVGDRRDDLGGAVPVGEANKSGIYTTKNPSPGFSG
jgi:hypothetical protein